MQILKSAYVYQGGMLEISSEWKYSKSALKPSTSKMVLTYLDKYQKLLY